jgi:hypothetical protein
VFNGAFVRQLLTHKRHWLCIAALTSRIQAIKREARTAEKPMQLSQRFAVVSFGPPKQGELS